MLYAMQIADIVRPVIAPEDLQNVEYFMFKGTFYLFKGAEPTEDGLLLKSVRNTRIDEQEISGPFEVPVSFGEKVLVKYFGGQILEYVQIKAKKNSFDLLDHNQRIVELLTKVVSSKKEYLEEKRSEPPKSMPLGELLAKKAMLEFLQINIDELQKISADIQEGILKAQK